MTESYLELLCNYSTLQKPDFNAVAVQKDLELLLSSTKLTKPQGSWHLSLSRTMKNTQKPLQIGAFTKVQ